MLCGSCQTDVEATKFCPNCGAALAKNETKQRSEVTLEWIRDIYASLGYEVSEIDKSDNSRSSFAAKHQKNPNLIIEFRPSLRVVTATSPWNIRAPGLMERGEFFKAVNSMNLETVCCQCSVPEKEMDSLYIQMTFFVSDVVSRLDVIAFNELATTCMRRVLSQPRVQKIVT